MTKQNTYNLLICLTLVSFGFFGSISHIFSLALIILTCFNYKISEQKNEIEFNAKIIFLALNGCFLLFLITSIFRSNFALLMHSLSPMLPLPFIGMLIIFHIRTGFKLSSKKISQFSQISVLFSLIFYLLLSISTDPNSPYYNFHAGRLMLLSGNPIPFSYAMLGISIFCLADWRNNTFKDKLITLLLFLTGAYFAGFLSGTRGTLLSIIFIAPITIFFIFNRFIFSIIIISILVPLGILFIEAGVANNIENLYFDRIRNGLETIFLINKNDESIWQRLQMWSAGIKAIAENPIYGYGITERFNALKPYLSSSRINYTHPHNDIIAGLIASGFLGGVAALFSLMAPIVAALLSPKWSSEKLYFGLMVSGSAMVTGNVSTVLFNDISSAWLAFSVYLIWSADFKCTQEELPKSKR